MAIEDRKLTSKAFQETVFNRQTAIVNRQVVMTPKDERCG